MHPEVIGLVPPWLIVGTALGLLASLLVAAVFYAGYRLWPPTEADTGSNGTRGRRMANGRSDRWYAADVGGKGGMGGCGGNGAEGGAGAYGGGRGDERRRREISAYLTEIGERFVEDRRIGGTIVPFYLPDRRVAITFDGHDYFRLNAAGIVTVLSEHELPARGLGRRFPFEVHEPGRGKRAASGAHVGRGGHSTAGTDGGHGRRSDRHAGSFGSGRTRSPRAAVEDAFAELGVPIDADVDEVKRAYRERVKHVHPDRGGDERSFRRVAEAYTTAKRHASGDDGNTSARGFSG